MLWHTCDSHNMQKAVKMSLEGKTMGRLMVRIFEPSGGKTNNVVSEQVQHKRACTSTEKS